MIRWFKSHGWARRRAVTNAQRRHVPILLVFHPSHGYGAVSERLYERYDTTGCTVVERIDE
jgi:hypothetical protein